MFIDKFFFPQIYILEKYNYISFSFSSYSFGSVRILGNSIIIILSRDLTPYIHAFGVFISFSLAFYFKTRYE